MMENWFKEFVMDTLGQNSLKQVQVLLATFHLLFVLFASANGAIADTTLVEKKIIEGLPSGCSAFRRPIETFVSKEERKVYKYLSARENSFNRYDIFCFGENIRISKPLYSSGGDVTIVAKNVEIGASIVTRILHQIDFTEKFASHFGDTSRGTENLRTKHKFTMPTILGKHPKIADLYYQYYRSRLFQPSTTLDGSFISDRFPDGVSPMYTDGLGTDAELKIRKQVGSGLGAVKLGKNRHASGNVTIISEQVIRKGNGVIDVTGTRPGKGGLGIPSRCYSGIWTGTISCSTESIKYFPVSGKASSFGYSGQIQISSQRFVDADRLKAVVPEAERQHAITRIENKKDRKFQPNLRVVELGLDHSVFMSGHSPASYGESISPKFIRTVSSGGILEDVSDSVIGNFLFADSFPGFEKDFSLDAMVATSRVFWTTPRQQLAAFMSEGFRTLARETVSRSDSATLNNQRDWSARIYLELLCQELLRKHISGVTPQDVFSAHMTAQQIFCDANPGDLVRDILAVNFGGAAIPKIANFSEVISHAREAHQLETIVAELRSLNLAVRAGNMATLKFFEFYSEETERARLREIEGDVKNLEARIAAIKASTPDAFDKLTALTNMAGGILSVTSGFGSVISGAKGAIGFLETNEPRADVSQFDAWVNLGDEPGFAEHKTSMATGLSDLSKGFKGIGSAIKVLDHSNNTGVLKEQISDLKASAKAVEAKFALMAAEISAIQAENHTHEDAVVARAFKSTISEGMLRPFDLIALSEFVLMIERNRLSGLFSEIEMNLIRQASVLSLNKESLGIVFDKFNATDCSVDTDTCQRFKLKEGQKINLNSNSGENLLMIGPVVRPTLTVSLPVVQGTYVVEN